MNAGRRTQADRTAATRRALIGAARLLFATEGYGAVGTERIVHEAGVTRGALYHQFHGGKADLFAAVLEEVEVDLTHRLAGSMQGVSGDDAVEVLVAGVDAWLDATADAEVQRIVLIDGPAVLGWERWREIGMRHGFGLVTAVLTMAMDAGTVPPQPVEPLAHLLIGALDEAALYVARAPDPAAARQEMGAVTHRLVRALLS